ncbi:MAG: hypothetical protein WAW80_04115 [Candidatus Saccharimonadales bacterium]
MKKITISGDDMFVTAFNGIIISLFETNMFTVDPSLTIPIRIFNYTSSTWQAPVLSCTHNLMLKQKVVSVSEMFFTYSSSGRMMA